VHVDEEGTPLGLDELHLEDPVIAHRRAQRAHPLRQLGPYRGFLEADADAEPTRYLHDLPAGAKHRDVTFGPHVSREVVDAVRARWEILLDDRPHHRRVELDEGLAVRPRRERPVASEKALRGIDHLALLSRVEQDLTRGLEQHREPERV